MHIIRVPNPRVSSRSGAMLVLPAGAVFRPIVGYRPIRQRKLLASLKFDVVRSVIVSGRDRRIFVQKLGKIVSCRSGVAADRQVAPIL